MDHTQFYASLEAGKIAEAYIFFGPEEFVKEKAFEALKKKLLSGAPEELNFTVMPSDASLGCISDACMTMPFMAERRLVLVKDHKLFAESAKGAGSDADALEPFIKSLRDMLCTVVFYITGNADKRRASFKTLSSAAEPVSFERLEERELVRWIVSSAKRKGKKISDNDARQLVFYTGSELFVLDNELEKLSAFAGSAESITLDDIQSLVRPSLEYNVFQMSDAFFRGDKKTGMLMLGTILDEGDHPLAIIGAMASRYRTLLQAKTLLESGCSKDMTIRRMGSTYPAKLAVSACDRFSDEKLHNAVKSLARADIDIKSGNCNEKIALERAVAELFL